MSIKIPLPDPTMIRCPQVVLDSVVSDLDSGLLKVYDVAAAINERAIKWYQDNGYETSLIDKPQKEKIMKLIRPLYVRNIGTAMTCGIAEAIEYDCSSDADGAVERARDVADAAARKLGALIALLHERNVLTDKDVLSLLSGFEQESE
jgi:hypothetical protein